MNEYITKQVLTKYGIFSFEQLEEYALSQRGLPPDLMVTITFGLLSDGFLLEWHFAEYLRDKLRFDHN